MFLSWQLLGSCCCTWTGGKQRHWLGEGLALPSPMHPSCRRTKAISNHHSWLLPHAWRCVGSGGRWVSPHHSGAGSTPRSTHCHHAPGSSSRTYRLRISARKKRREWNGKKKMKEGFPLAHANNSDLEYLFRNPSPALQNSAAKRLSLWDVPVWFHSSPCCSHGIPECKAGASPFALCLLFFSCKIIRLLKQLTAAVEKQCARISNARQNKAFPSEWLFGNISGWDL